MPVAAFCELFEWLALCYFFCYSNALVGKRKLLFLAVGDLPLGFEPHTLNPSAWRSSTNIT